jgi:hypothetical protein
MINTTVGAGAGAASRYGSGSGSDQKRRLLAAPAPAPSPQHCILHWGSINFLPTEAKMLNTVIFESLRAWYQSMNV